MHKRKHIINLSIAFLGILPACQKEVPYVQPEGTVSDVVVRIGTNLRKPDYTKGGLGVINDWDNRQKIFVYGIPRVGSNAATLPDKLDFNFMQIDNVQADAVPAAGNPAAAQEINVYRIGTEPYYYREERRYEFFGYYVDNAIVPPRTSFESDTKPKPFFETVGGEKRLVLPVEIDGSQDIMLANTNKENDNTPELNPFRIYSAYSARKGVIPNLVFKHQLSRFNVYIQKGDVDSLTITRIQAFSKTKGTLVIANETCSIPDPNMPETAQSYVQVEGGLDKSTITGEKWLELKCGEDNHNLTAADTLIPVEGWRHAGFLMMMPGESKYHFRLGLTQPGYSDYPRMSPDGRELYDIETEFDVDFARLLQPSGDPKNDGNTKDDVDELDTFAMPGHQYDVNIVVYGLQQIRISVSLSPWKTGGSFLVDHDPKQPIDYLNIAANDAVTLYKSDSLAIEPKIMIKSGSELVEAGKEEMAGIRFFYEIADESIASVDTCGVVHGINKGVTTLLITAKRFEVRSDSLVLTGKGTKSVRVTVADAPPKSPELKVFDKTGTVIPSGDTLVWNVPVDGDKLEIFEVHSGSGVVSYMLSNQRDATGNYADILTKTGTNVFVVDGSKVPSPDLSGKVPFATADITVRVAAADGYQASPDYLIHVKIVNIP